LKKIYTHLSLDLDAASAVSLYLLDNHMLSCEDVVFVPADFDGKDMATEDVAIDIYAGGKGIKGTKSAFSTVLNNEVENKYKSAFTNVSYFIDIVDTTHGLSSRELPNDGVPTMLDTFRWLKKSCNSDKYLLQQWSHVISGIWHSHKDYLKAVSAAKTAVWEGNVAIIKGIVPLQTSTLLFNSGAELVVYESGFNMGVMRSPKCNVHIGRKLKDFLPEWFHHPDGFLSCWGTNKAPKDIPSDYSVDFVADLASALV